jgi:Na+/proline symporter
MDPKLALCTLVGLIISYSYLRSRGLTQSDFLYNARKTGTSSTFLSVVAGNIGAGTIYGLYTFGTTKPLLAISIALSYSTGLAVAGLLSSTIRRATENVKEASLIGFLAERHGVSEKKWLLWLSMGTVFLIQLSVELIAVADVIRHVFQLNGILSLFVASATIGSYLIIGGYRSATVTAQIQAPLVTAMLLTIAVGVWIAFNASNSANYLLHNTDYFESVAAVFLITPTVFLSIDNWHRIIAAGSNRSAKVGFLVAAILCGACYLTVVFAAIQSQKIIPIEGLTSFVSDKIAWLIPVIIMIAIFSTMDTAIPPLVAAIPGSNKGLARARLYTLGILIIITVLASLFGSILQGIIAAFSSLAVFLPATTYAIFHKNLPSAAVLYGIPISVVAAIVMTFYLKEYALIGSILISVALYCSLVALNKN